jgi:3-oxoacyl-[acyl-carrier-protein] synthase-1
MAPRRPIWLAVTGVGGVSPVGLDAIQSCASVRAGVCRFRQWPEYQPLSEDPEWEVAEPISVSRVPGLASEPAGPERLLVLATLALRDLIAQVPLRRAEVATAGLFLALPEPDGESGTWALGPDWGRRLCAHAGLPSMSVVAARCEGSPGGLALLDDVRRYLEDAPASLALAVFVDSYIDVRRLDVLDREARLKSARTTDGIVPGESAWALLLETPAQATRQPHGFLGPVGLGQEPHLRSSDQESCGRGLTDALRGALAGAVASAPRWGLCDLNGESYRAAEWGVVSTRLGAELASVGRLSHPADGLGDIGAATGGMLVAQALAGFRRGYACADEAVVWTSSSVHGLRAAVRVLPKHAKEVTRA